MGGHMLPEISEIEAKAKEWQPIMRISDWEIVVSYVDQYRMKDLSGDDDCIAYCWTQRKRKFAHIYFNQDDDDNEKNWQSNLAHEMYHVASDDLAYQIEVILAFVPEDQRKALREAYIVYIERLVDDLAKGFITIQKGDSNALPIPGPAQIFPCQPQET
jgi:hypothetical protein